MKRALPFAVILFAALVSVVAYGSEAQLATVRFTTALHEAFLRANGQPTHRATLTPDATTAESNLTAAGGTAVTYTLVGGERICVQSPEAAYIEVIAAASMTAAGAKGFRVGANEALSANCFTLARDAKSVSALCVSGACTGVKLFEVR